MVISCCPVGEQFGIQFVIFTVHLKSFSVVVNRVKNFFLSIFFVTFFEVHFCYR